MKTRKPLNTAGAAKRKQTTNDKISAALRDIGELPTVKNPERKGRALASFRSFCEEYFPGTFFRAFAPYHDDVIQNVEETAKNGGLQAIALPRGAGKTSICECAIIWALVTGSHKFLVIISATQALANSTLRNVKTRMVSPELVEDFPDIFWPIKMLRGEARRAKGQTLYGERTLIEWGLESVTMPTVPGSQCSGALIVATGLTGGIRGLVRTNDDGTQMRPTWVLLDDPQTKESAASPGQTRTRLEIINGDVMGLAGQKQRISGVLACTVIEDGDLSDQILDPDLNPHWHGIRVKMLPKEPENQGAWEKYAKKLKDFQRDGHKNYEKITEYYLDNREILDAGAEASWPESYNDDEASAIQHAMHLKIQDPRAFFAEYQNEPQDRSGDGSQLNPEVVFEKINGRRQGEIPLDTEKITMFIDVQKRSLYFCVCAYAQDSTGALIDYGTFPDQRREYFTLANTKKTLAGKYGGLDTAACWVRAFGELCSDYLSRKYARADGATLSIDRILIDANDGNAKPAINRFLEDFDEADRITPALGIGLGAKHSGFNERAPKTGERRGAGWRLNPSHSGLPRTLTSDVNYWKSYTRDKLSLPLESREVMTINGEKGNNDASQMLIDNLTAEFYAVVRARGRSVEEWSNRPGRDNHFFDCLVGCNIAANFEGITASAQPTQNTGSAVKKFKLSF